MHNSLKNMLLCFGYGGSAQAVSKQLLTRGWRVIGTTRSQKKADILANDDAEIYVWPGTDMRRYIHQAGYILLSIPPNVNGDPVLQHYKTTFKMASPLWVGYLSTTGVYGNHNGNWVNEETSPNPTTKRGCLRLAAELAWRDVDVALHIFRLAGIYGPQRGPFAKLRAGTARRIIKKNQVFSRIHLDDIAQTLLASMAKPAINSIYNLCDDLPAPPQDVIAYAAKLLQLKIPKAEDFNPANLSPLARSFYAENKRVRNTKIKNHLGVKLLYPDYKSGLQAIAKAELGEKFK